MQQSDLVLAIQSVSIHLTLNFNNGKYRLLLNQRPCCTICFIKNDILSFKITKRSQQTLSNVFIPNVSVNFEIGLVYILNIVQTLIIIFYLFIVQLSCDTLSYLDQINRGKYIPSPLAQPAKSVTHSFKTVRNGSRPDHGRPHRKN